MAKGVRQGFAQGLRRVKRVIHTLEQARDDPSGNREMVPQETLRSHEQVERVADLLTIVDELRFVAPSEPRHPQQALRVGREEPIRPPQQHRRGVQ
jgi:hypothetical protein